MKISEEIIEKVAEAIFNNSAGLTNNEYNKIMGEPRKRWNKLPWHSWRECLVEWERDEYRQMARAAIEALRVAEGELNEADYS